MRQKQYYIYDELKRKTYYDLKKICIDEELINGYRDNLNREDLMNIILKFRSREKTYCISEYREDGLPRLQELFDNRKGYMLNDSNKIKVPHKIVIYKKMPLTEEDEYRISVPENISENNVYLINGKNYLCGIFQLIKNKDESNSYCLITDDNFLRLEGLKNQNYSLMFFNKVDEKFLFNYYHKGENVGIVPASLNYYQIPLDSFIYSDMEVSDTPLCLDFGTANTTAGIYMDKYYINNLPQHKILSGHVSIDKINYVKFPKGLDDFSNVIPTVVYIKNCFNEANIQYLFGYDVEDRLKENDYNLAGSIFYGIKNWVKSVNKKERIVDENGDIRYVERKVIIKAYIDYIVDRAEFIFKCKFKNIHITTPVKLKNEFLNMFKEILPNYHIITKDSLDEGVAVLYNSIERLIYKQQQEIIKARETNTRLDNSKRVFQDDKEYKALIIDCGGGTTDLASCVFKIKSKDINYDIDIRTTFENSEESFGGNNITYRIMQYLKILLAQYYTKNEGINVNTLITNESELIFRDIDENGVKSIYEKIEEEYAKADKIIPTKFAEYENKASDMYGKVKNNFFFMWEIAELLKKEIFKHSTIVRTKYGAKEMESSDLSVTVVKSWNLNFYSNGTLQNIKTYPDIIINKNEIIKLIKGDIYEVFRRFLTSYYERDILSNYSLVKLSGQSCKVNIFNDILKEFIPGKRVDFRRNIEESEEQLKIACLDGAVRYLNSSKIGNIKVGVRNDIPIVPYSLHAHTYLEEDVVLLRTGEQAGAGAGFIKKISQTEILPMRLKNKEQEVKKLFTYVNKLEDYKEMDEQDVLKSLNNHFVQDDLDDIQNGETKFFAHTDENYWGFYVCGVRRESNQTYLGKKEYFSFEEDITTISFFDGMH
ncbi:hypothetical protein [Fusobacterium sp. PH5-44]|uniref:hypothetical protein n=1 Tax=unclassified Fusobacterium TaxID=2648384 RepID=UPI003D1FFD2E